jgi:hypothetical protein
MSDALNNYIANCKAPKAVAKVTTIVSKILKGFRLGMSSQAIADKLNEICVYTLMGKRWTANSVQVQALKMARFDLDSSLAWGFAKAMKSGEATQADLDLLLARTR